MGQSNVIVQFAPSTLLMPAIHPQKALMSVFPVALPPSISWSRGSLLLPGSGTAVNDVQTITPPGSGTFTISGYNPVTGGAFATAPIAYNAAASAVQSALVAAMGAAYAATTGTGPYVVTFGGTNAAGQPIPLMTVSAGSIAHTTVGSRAAACSIYAGSGTPSGGILKRDYSTDSAGNSTMGLNGGIGDQQGGTFAYAEAYFAGAFYADEIPNLDANAVSALNAHYIGGAAGAGRPIIVFPG